MTSTECSSQKKFYRFFFFKRNSTATKFITLSTNLGRRGKNFHYGEHNVQGSAADQAAFFKLVTLEDAEGDKLLLFSYPIRHQFTLFCDALEL